MKYNTEGLKDFFNILQVEYYFILFKYEINPEAIREKNWENKPYLQIKYHHRDKLKKTGGKYSQLIDKGFTSHIGKALL